MDYREFCQTLNALLEGRNLRADGAETAINAIALGVGVSAGEIALLLADDRAHVLNFFWPRSLQNAGSVPFSSKESLAARTYRERVGTLNNRFAATRHASIFEALPLKEQGGKALPIQKIVSVPLLRNDICLGVLQVCRKAADAKDAGPDFSQADLRGLAQVAQVLARHL